VPLHLRSLLDPPIPASARPGSSRRRDSFSMFSSRGLCPRTQSRVRAVRDPSATEPSSSPTQNLLMVRERRENTEVQMVQWERVCHRLRTIGTRDAHNRIAEKNPPEREMGTGTTEGTAPGMPVAALLTMDDVASLPSPWPSAPPPHDGHYVAGSLITT
jgi:hypothetical protein